MKWYLSREQCEVLDSAFGYMAWQKMINPIKTLKPLILLLTDVFSPLCHVPVIIFCNKICIYDDTLCLYQSSFIAALV